MKKELETYPTGKIPPREDASPVRNDKNRKKLGTKAKFFTGFTLISSILGVAYTQKDQYTDDLANFSRSVIGDNNTARLEKYYFYLEDQKNKLVYEITGDKKSSFDKDFEVSITYSQSVNPGELNLPDNEPALGEPSAVVEPPMPAPLILPEIQYLGVPLAEGEGIWRTDDLPRTSPEDPLMVKTVVRPDASRPYAKVNILLLDKRRIRLNMVGGTKSPGETSGVSGPGRIPAEDRQNLLVAFNGGFQGNHAEWGMYANEKTYKSLVNGFASVAVTSEGEILMGEWGRTLEWRDDMVAVRQNAALLVENCEVSDRTLENNKTWGYIVYLQQDNVTRRSAIGLTQNGDLLVATGDNVKPDTLARALWAAGACTAMQLDINTPQVNTSLYFQRDDGSVKGEFFGGTEDPDRFLRTQEYDFMYATLDERNYIP